jgi:hypothetical protein
MRSFFGANGTHSVKIFSLIGVMMLGMGLSSPATAQTGGSAVVFLMIEPDSRAAGMGNTGVAVADNAYAVFWNPAGLAFQEGAEASLTHSNWLPELGADLFYEYLVGKYNIGPGTIGAQVTFLNLGESEHRVNATDPGETFRSYDLATGLSYGFNVSERVALGTGARFIYSNLASGVGGGEYQPGVSAGFDLAGLYRSAPFSLGGIQTTASAGFNLANMGPKIKYREQGQADPIPTNLRFGYAFTFDFDEYNRLTFANDFTKLLTHSEITEDGRVSDPFYQAIFSSWQSIDVDLNADGEVDETLGPVQQLMIGTGLEYWYNRLFAARAGYFYENPYNGDRQFLTFGAGIRYSLVGVDFSYIYALENDHPLSNTLRFSLLLNFNG